jgi:uncharacterized protein involved in exopolysaccharide biosynthesis
MSETSTSQSVEGDIGLLDIVDFFREGWKALLAVTLAGGVIGLGTALVLPEKYESRALIQPARAIDKEVEPVKVLAEKMRTPSYYSKETVAACALDRSVDPADELARELRPRVARDSNFVSLSFRGRSTRLAEECLASVLADVVRNQTPLSRQLIEKVEAEIKLTQQRLQRARSRNDQELTQNKSRLVASRERLAATERFIADYESRVAIGGAGQREGQTETPTALLSTIMAKQAERRELQILINDLAVKVQAGITGREDELQALERQIADLQRSLLSPATEEARFATPLYSPISRAEPRRSLIVALALITGMMLGLALLIVRRLVAHVRAQDRARRAAQTS